MKVHSNWKHYFWIYFQGTSNFEALLFKNICVSFFIVSDLRTGHTSSNWLYYVLFRVRLAESIRKSIKWNMGCVLLELKIRCCVCFLVWYVLLIFSCQSNFRCCFLWFKKHLQMWEYNCFKQRDCFFTIQIINKYFVYKLQLNCYLPGCHIIK